MMRLLVFALLFLASPALAQPAPLEQRVAAEIGQCVIARHGQAMEIEALKARIAELEKKVPPATPEPPKN